MFERVSKTRVCSEKDMLLKKPLTSCLESGNFLSEGFYPRRRRRQSLCKAKIATKEGDSGLIDWSVCQKDINAGVLKNKALR